MARKIVFSLFLLASCFCIFGFAKASVSDDIYFTDLTINKTSFQPGEEIKGTVIVGNSGNQVVGDLTFSFELLAGKEVNGLLNVIEKRLDSKKMAETFTLDPGGKASKNFSYTLPENLPSGNVFLSVRLTNSRGERMIWIEKKITIESNNNFLLLSKGLIVLKNGAQSPPATGVNIDAGDETKIQFDVENISSQNQTVYPEVKTYVRNADDANLIKKEKGDSLILAPGEKKQRIITLPALTAPESYYTEVKFFDEKTSQPISNALYFRWVVKGQDNAKVLSVSADKSTYQIGETANILVKTSGPAGSFKFDPKNPPTGTLSVKLFDDQGALAGQKETEIILGAAEMNIKVPIYKYVANPKIEAVISKGQNVLDDYSVKIDSSMISPNETKSRVIVLTVTIIVILAIIAGIFWAVWVRRMRILEKKRSKKTIDVRIKNKVTKERLVFNIIFWSILAIVLVSVLCFLIFGNGWFDILNIINGNFKNNPGPIGLTEKKVVVAGDSDAVRPSGRVLPYFMKGGAVSVMRDGGFTWPATIGEDGCLDSGLLLDQTNSIVKLTDPNGSSPVTFAPDQIVCIQIETSAMNDGGGLLYSKYGLFSAPNNDQAHSSILVANSVEAQFCMGARSCIYDGGGTFECCDSWAENSGFMPAPGAGCPGTNACYKTMSGGGGVGGGGTSSDDLITSDDWGGTCTPRVPRVLDEDNNLLTFLPSDMPYNSSGDWISPPPAFYLDPIIGNSYYVMDEVADVARLTVCLSKMVEDPYDPKLPPTEQSTIPAGNSRIYFQYSGIHDSPSILGMDPSTPTHWHWQVGYMPVKKDYKPPTPDPTVNFNYCTDTPKEGKVEINWAYNHGDNLPQQSYIMSLAVYNAQGTDIEETHGYWVGQDVPSGGTGSAIMKVAEVPDYGVPRPPYGFLPTLQYNRKYNIQVQVLDSRFVLSSYSDPAIFTTSESPFPSPFLSHDPIKAVLGQAVHFYNDTQFFDSVCSANPNNLICSYQWTFEGGTPAASSGANNTVVFNSSGNKTITLTAADSNSNSCSTTETIEVMAQGPLADIKCRDFYDTSDLPVVNGQCQGYQNGIKFLNTSTDPVTGAEIINSNWFVKGDFISDSYPATPNASCDASSPDGALCSFTPSSLSTGAWIVKLRVADNSSLVGEKEQKVYIKKDISPNFMCSIGGSGPAPCTGPWFDCEDPNFFVEKAGDKLCIRDDLVLPIHSEPSEDGSSIIQRKWSKNDVALKQSETGGPNSGEFALTVKGSDVSSGNIALKLFALDDVPREGNTLKNIKIGVQIKYRPQWWETAPF